MITTPPATPKELIATLQSGGEIDDARWAQFDAFYRPVIPLFLQQRFGALIAPYADDIAQEVMIKLIAAFRNGQYDATKGKFRSYLAAMSHNAAANTLRKLHPERTQSLETIDPETLEDPKAQRAYDQLDRQFREAVYRRMTALYFASFAHDPTDREVWEAYRRGETSSVTAQRIGKTPEAVRQQRKRILATLQNLAEE